MNNFGKSTEFSKGRAELGISFFWGWSAGDSHGRFVRAEIWTKIIYYNSFPFLARPHRKYLDKNIGIRRGKLIILFIVFPHKFDRF
jgi:hypothetical protein